MLYVISRRRSSRVQSLAQEEQYFRWLCHRRGGHNCGSRNHGRLINGMDAERKQDICCVWFIYPVLCWCWCPAIGTSSMDWAPLNRLLPEDGDRIQLRNAGSSAWTEWGIAFVQVLCANNRIICFSCRSNQGVTKRREDALYWELRTEDPRSYKHFLRMDNSHT
jgi:hypothetical protein